MNNTKIISPEEGLFRRRCYEKYQLDWMITHGYSLQDAFNILREGYEQGCNDGDIDGGTRCDEDFDYVEKYFEKRGFDEQMFACGDEFYDCEYQNLDYMKHLLSEDDFKQYCVFNSINEPDADCTYALIACEDRELVFLGSFSDQKSAYKAMEADLAKTMNLDEVPLIWAKVDGFESSFAIQSDFAWYNGRTSCDWKIIEIQL